MNAFDEQVKRDAERLRNSDWMNGDGGGLTPEERRIKSSLEKLGKLGKVKPAKDKGFGILDGKVRSAGGWLAKNWDQVDGPVRPFIARKFGLSFDDAHRAVAEAERLIGGGS